MIRKLEEYNFKEYFNYINKYYYNDSLIMNTINSKVLNKNIINILNKYSSDNNIVNFILKYKSDYIKNILININWDNLIYNKKEYDEYLDIIDSLPKNVQSKIYRRNNNYIRNILSEYDKDILKEFLNSDGNNKNAFVMNMQNTILKIFNISSEKIDYCKTIIKYCDKGNILDLLRNMEEFFDRVEIDINLFFQYSSYDFGNNIIGNIIDIINDNEIDSFVMIKNYLFNNYFDSTLNNANLIVNLNIIIKNYKLYKDLLLELCNKNVILSSIDKSNLNLLFNGKLYDIPLNLYELNELKKKQFNIFREEILNENTSINRIKDIFFNSIISFNSMFF